MAPLDLIRDKFSQDCTVETVLHLVMSHFGMSEEEAQAEIDKYSEIIDEIDRWRRENPWKKIFKLKRKLREQEKDMKKALLIGNGFTSHLINAYLNDKMMKRLFDSAGPICKKAQELFLPFCQVYSESTSTTDITETRKRCVVELLENYGIKDAEKLYEEYFLQYGLFADAARGEIVSVESLLKVISLFSHNDFFAEESILEVKRLANRIYYNNGENGLSAVSLSAREPIRRWLSEYQEVFTTNYDCVLDDAYEGKVKHLHGGFYMKDRYEKSQERLSPEDAYLVWGISGEDKEEQTRGGPIVTSDGYYLATSDDYLIAVRSELEFYLMSLQTGAFEKLDIFGYSGENDQHINLAISQNQNLKTVCYYCNPRHVNDKENKNEIMRRFKLPEHMELILRPWTEIWDKIPIGI